LSIEVHTPADPETLITREVYLCAYARMNEFLERSGLPKIPLKQELTEMALLDMPAGWDRRGLTMMCGPFFSILPFPMRPGLFTLSHVRYTPHAYWNEGPKTPASPFSGRWPPSQASHMLKDAARYLPLISEAHVHDSLWAIKTVLPMSETDDSRPILFLRDHGVRGLTCILGGKIDNVYDMLKELDHVPV
jgi:hypothetical protein